MSRTHTSQSALYCDIEAACGGSAFLEQLDACTEDSATIALGLVGAGMENATTLHEHAQLTAPTVCPDSCTYVATATSTVASCEEAVYQTELGEMLTAAKQRCECGELVHDINTGCFYELNMTNPIANMFDNFMACPASCATSIENLKASPCLFDASV